MKTYVAGGIADRVDTLIVLEADYYYQQLGKKNPLSIAFGGTRPQTNIGFLNYFQSIIDDEINNGKSVVIVMAATTKECKEKLINNLIDRNDFFHIILDAEKETIISRIQKDSGNRDKEFAIDNLEENLKFLSENYDEAIHIDTDKRDIEYVIDTIMEIIQVDVSKR